MVRVWSPLAVTVSLVSTTILFMVLRQMSRRKQESLKESILLKISVRLYLESIHFECRHGMGSLLFLRRTWLGSSRRPCHHVYQNVYC
jgi:hypothetical protein